MKKLNKIEQAEFEVICKNVGKTLIHTMLILEIPNCIEAQFKMDGYKYDLKFEREKI